jgi:hypothetical protein
MKLATTIIPTLDGTVVAQFGNVSYSFELDEASGDLTAEVDNEDHAKALLSTGNFYPESDDDFAAAADLMSEPTEEDSEELESEDEASLDAAPLEANTQPKRFRPKAK